MFVERWLSPVEGARLEIECTALTAVPWVRIPLSPPVIYNLTLDMVEPVSILGGGSPRLLVFYTFEALKTFYKWDRSTDI